MSENSATQLLLFADSFLQCTLQLLELSELCLDYGGVRLQYARNKLERFLIFDIRNQTHEIDRFNIKLKEEHGFERLSFIASLDLDSASLFYVRLRVNRLRAHPRLFCQSMGIPSVLFSPQQRLEYYDLLIPPATLRS